MPLCLEPNHSFKGRLWLMTKMQNVHLQDKSPAYGQSCSGHRQQEPLLFLSLKLAAITLFQPYRFPSGGLSHSTQLRVRSERLHREGHFGLLPIRVKTQFPL